MRTNLRRTTACLLLPLLGLCAVSAQAWGGYGHRVTAYVAESLLTDRARDQVQRLLGSGTLADAAIFMDEQREMLEQRWPGAARWHYDNQPVCAVPRLAYCADGECATRKIEQFQKILKNAAAPAMERELALKLLVHMLGDLHQPLHMADNADRGGNDVSVRLRGRVYRLHELFDTTLIREVSGKRGAKRYAGALMSSYGSQFKTWRKGDVAAWAQESHRLAAADVYGQLPQFGCNVRLVQPLDLPERYVQDAERYLPEQLAKAGVRIAAILNGSLN